MPDLVLGLRILLAPTLVGVASLANMEIGALRRALKRFKHWHRLEDDVKTLTESGGAPIGRVLSTEEQDRLFKVAEGNPEWLHVYCAAVLAANTSMRGVEIKHLRRKDIDLETKALHIRRSKNEGSASSRSIMTPWRP